MDKDRIFKNQYLITQGKAKDREKKIYCQVLSENNPHSGLKRHFIVLECKFVTEEMVYN